MSEPLGGAWDRDGVYGIGIYTYLSAGWSLRNAPSAGPADAGSFVFGTPAHSFPVSGDWNGDGIDTVAIKQTQGLTWTARNANAAGAPEISFDYGQANDLPLAWRR